jgi:hypothetical protein
MSKMNPEIKQKWLMALRSGEYKQSRGELNRMDPAGIFDGYCCLGVLCDLHAKETGHKWDIDGCYYSNAGLPPKEVVDWAEIPTINQIATVRGIDVRAGLVSLAGQNDIGLPFAEIATLIEQQL